MLIRAILRKRKSLIICEFNKNCDTYFSTYSSYLDGDQISSVPKPEACIAAIMKGARLIECESAIFNCC